jgi:hypothetical protein
MIKHRIKGIIKCDCCDGRICQHNNLAVTHPKLCEEWYYDKNINTPDKYTFGSNEKVSWICPNNKCGCHIYIYIYDKTSGQECPFCVKGIPCPHNTAKIAHPDICDEWDYEKNDSRPEDYSRGSKIKVWWTCSQYSTHKWQATILSRLSVLTGCPYCYGKRSETYNLLTDNPELALEWHFEKNISNPEDYALHSHANVWWKCKKILSH